MKRRTQHIYSFLLDPKSIIFGVAIFNLVWVWLRSSEWNFHKNIFMAVLLLVSSVLILFKRVWSDLLAAVLSGYLPIQFVWEFWMLARNAEVPVFSYAHFSYFLRGIVEVAGEVILFFALTIVILICAAYSITRSAPGHMSSNDVLP